MSNFNDPHTINCGEIANSPMIYDVEVINPREIINYFNSNPQQVNYPPTFSVDCDIQASTYKDCLTSKKTCGPKCEQFNTEPSACAIIEKAALCETFNNDIYCPITCKNLSVVDKLSL